MLVSIKLQGHKASLIHNFCKICVWSSSIGSLTYYGFSPQLGPQCPTITSFQSLFHFSPAALVPGFSIDLKTHSILPLWADDFTRLVQENQRHEARNFLVIPALHLTMAKATSSEGPPLTFTFEATVALVFYVGIYFFIVQTTIRNDVSALHQFLVCRSPWNVSSVRAQALPVLGTAISIAPSTY